ncbi:hypothetical protein Rin_00021030 [Candidatus Regiella insecticola 5.15]|uniref:Uncharacterized protein n=1 Tax=Candidatus Regiella insecticola 5.15 TaxID=1005043 RepID=G2H206_9ENTR|nr:hypothetical protein Rin_00021030 [Candidatus Regiella insecticola 5.15]
MTYERVVSIYENLSWPVETRSISHHLAETMSSRIGGKDKGTLLSETGNGGKGKVTLSAETRVTARYF